MMLQHPTHQSSAPEVSNGRGMQGERPIETFLAKTEKTPQKEDKDEDENGETRLIDTLLNSFYRTKFSLPRREGCVDVHKTRRSRLV